MNHPPPCRALNQFEYSLAPKRPKFHRVRHPRRIIRHHPRCPGREMAERVPAIIEYFDLIPPCFTAGFLVSVRVLHRKARQLSVYTMLSGVTFEPSSAGSGFFSPNPLRCERKQHISVGIAHVWLGIVHV